MSQTFQRYDDEFQSLIRQVRASFGSDGGFKDEEIADAATNTVDCIDQCDDLLQQMALEARSVPDASLKRELLAKVRSYKGELQNLKDEDNKRSLMSSARGNGSSSDDHRERMRQQQEMLQNQNKTLDSARRVLQETEQVALEITDELSNNRATIESASGRVRQVSSMAGRARRIISSMNQRSRQQKMLMYGLAASAAILLFVFFKFLR